MTTDRERSMESIVWALGMPPTTDPADDQDEGIKGDMLHNSEDQELEECLLEGFVRHHLNLATFKKNHELSMNVIRLRVCDREGNWHCGTASALRSDILVTAAHVCYPQKKSSTERTHAKAIIAIANYHGEASIDSNTTQSRHATHVILLNAYLGGDKRRDIACILLDNGFVDLQECRFISTPAVKMDVVAMGYPGNNTTNVIDACAAPNPHDCTIESPGKAEYDMNRGKLICLFSTDGGNSGGPVYQQGTSNIVAIFTGGLNTGKINLACRIGPDPDDRFDNSLDAWVAFFEQLPSIQGLQDIHMKPQAVSVTYRRASSGDILGYTWQYGTNVGSCSKSPSTTYSVIGKLIKPFVNLGFSEHNESLADCSRETLDSWVMVDSKDEVSEGYDAGEPNLIAEYQGPAVVQPLESESWNLVNWG